jgi:drug/metabolite transporter (DMT)-like permease
MTVPASRTTPSTIAAFALLVVLVGTNIVAIRFTNRELAPLWNAGFRFALASGLFAAIAALQRRGWPTYRVVRGSVVYGLLAFAGFFAFVYVGLVHATAALGQTVLALGPLMTLVIASAIGMERLHGRAVAASALALVGIAVAFGAQEHLDVPAASLVALAAGAASFAVGGIVAKRLPAADAVIRNAVGTAVGAAVLLTLSRFAGEPWTLPRSTEAWLWFVYLVVPGTVVIFLLFLYLLDRLPATVVAYQFVLAPIVSITLAWLLLGESIGPGTLVGAAIVVGAVYLGALHPAAGEPVPREARTHGAAPP